MNNNYIDDIIRIVQSDTWQAEYIPLPISSKSVEGCQLPVLTPPPGPMIPVESPKIVKSCAPLFIEFPIVPEVFSLPENCPEGISFTDAEVPIYAQVSDIPDNPAGSITVGASQGDSVCNFDFHFPPIVVPCFPGGPQITSAAGITISDPNKNTVTTTPIVINKAEDTACSWMLDGQVNIVLPYIPCPSGIGFGDSEIIIRDQEDGPIKANPSITLERNISNACLYDVNFPDLTIPCYPDGPKFLGTVAINIKNSGVPVSTSDIGISAKDENAPCEFTLTGGPINIDIPCVTEGVQVHVAPIVITDPYLKGNGYGAVLRLTKFNPEKGITNVKIIEPGHNYSSGTKIFVIGGDGEAELVPVIPTTGNRKGTISEVQIQSAGHGYNESDIVMVIDGGSSDSINIIPIESGAHTDLCNITVSLPPISIPCFPDGIRFTDPIFFTGYDWVSDATHTDLLANQKIDLTDEGGRNPAKPCEWITDTVIHLPVPNCDGGFKFEVSGFRVKVGNRVLPKIAFGQPTGGLDAYESVTLRKAKGPAPNPNLPPDQQPSVCITELTGDIKLNIPEFMSRCADFKTGGTGLKFTIKDLVVKEIDGTTSNLTQYPVAGDRWGSIFNLTAYDCGFGLNGELAIPAMYCDTYSVPHSNVQFYRDGNLDTGSSLILEPLNYDFPHCGLQLTGTINLGSTGGGSNGGMGSFAPSNWSPDNTYEEKAQVYSPFVECGMALWSANKLIPSNTVTPDVPGISDKWTFRSMARAQECNPYEVIKASEIIQSDDSMLKTDATLLEQKDATVKVVPRSFLLKSEIDLSRIQVFGLDMPFVLKPREVVYLEVVYLLDTSTALSGQANPIPMYGAIAKGFKYDEDISDDAGTKVIIPAADTADAVQVPYKLISKKLMNDADPEYTLGDEIVSGDKFYDYAEACVNKYVGLTDPLKEDLIKLQCKAFKKLGMNTLASSVLFQFKSYTIIAKAEDSTTNATYGKPSNLTLIYKTSLPNSDTKKYNVQQLVKTHLAFKNSTIKIGSANVAVSTTVPTLNYPMPKIVFNGDQPKCEITNSVEDGKRKIQIKFSKPDNDDTKADLLINLYTNFLTSVDINSKLQFLTAAKVNASLEVGAGPVDHKVYYTIDGSIPTIFTGESKGKTKRYEPENDCVTIRDVDNVDTLVKSIVYVSAYPEFAVNAPKAMRADRTQNPINWVPSL
jgi:hypothetical protein